MTKDNASIQCVRLTPEWFDQSRHIVQLERFIKEEKLLFACPNIVQTDISLRHFRLVRPLDLIHHECSNTYSLVCRGYPGTILSTKYKFPLTSQFLFCTCPNIDEIKWLDLDFILNTFVIKFFIERYAIALVKPCSNTDVFYLGELLGFNLDFNTVKYIPVGHTTVSIEQSYVASLLMQQISIPCQLCPIEIAYPTKRIEHHPKEGE